MTFRHPHPRRTTALATAAAVVLSVLATVTGAGPAAASPGRPAATTAAPLGVQNIVRDSNLTQVRDLLNGINAYRAQKGLKPVKYSPTVSVMTQEWSDRIAATESPYEHRPNFWADPRVGPAQSPAEINAVAWSRNAAELIAWWKTSPAHNAAMLKPDVNVIGVGVTFTDGNWRTTPGRFTMFGVVDLFKYAPVPSNATATVVSTPRSGGTTPVSAPAKATPAICPGGRAARAAVRPAAIRSAADVLAVDARGTLWDYPATGASGLASRRALMTGFGGAQDVFAADWNQDGILDVVTIWKSGPLTVHRGTAAGGFGAAATIGRGWAGMTAAVGPWCSGDRFPGIVAYRPNGQMLLYRNLTGGAASGGVVIGAGWRGLSFSMADVDGNGAADLAVRRPDGVMALYRSNGQGQFLGEGRRVIGSGWNGVVSTRTLYGYERAGSAGLIAKWSNGRLSYYRIAGGGLGSRTEEGIGWGPYRLVK